MVGRPSSYTPELAEIICERLIAGESLIDICDAADMPNASTVYRWVEHNPEFSNKYVRARELQAHGNAERALRDAVNAKDAALGRLAFDARRWHAGKMLPKVYGDRVDLNHSGRISVGEMTDEQIQARLADLARKVGTGSVAGGTGSPDNTENDTE